MPNGALENRGLRQLAASAVGKKSRIHADSIISSQRWGQHFGMVDVCRGNRDRETGDDRADRGVVLVMVDHRSENHPVPQSPRRGGGIRSGVLVWRAIGWVV